MVDMNDELLMEDMYNLVEDTYNMMVMVEVADNFDIDDSVIGMELVDDKLHCVMNHDYEPQNMMTVEKIEFVEYDEHFANEVEEDLKAMEMKPLMIECLKGYISDHLYP